MSKNGSKDGLGFSIDTAVRFLRKADRKLAKVMERAGAFRVTPPARMTPFQMLMRSIVYQQLSGRAAATIYGRTAALCRNPRFPQPAELLSLSYESLRGAGLSNNKTLAIQDLADKALSGVVPSRKMLRTMADEAVVERLTQVRGIGRWTVEMLLLFYLGRADVFPEADLGVRKGIACRYGFHELPEGDALQAVGDRWRPYRSVGSWYMWRAAGMDDGSESPVTD